MKVQILCNNLGGVMWHRYLGIVGALGVVLATAPSAMESDQSEPPLAGLTVEDHHEIAAIPELFVERALVGDWDAVADLYHPAAIQMPPDEPAVMGREAIRHALSLTLGAEGGVRLEDFSVNIREVEGIGDLIYVRATYHLEMVITVGGEEVSVKQHGPYVNILRRDEGGGWRIFRQIYNRDHPPAVLTRGPST
jgi:ketosteroid isomerase-like protein